mmetsp:Transcript_79572/g.177973  ORF Transcript_79572/g.177973 Transcript_79572/m.177973 type:complete len:404 (-) Transcript_79572:27-1238(-)
MVFDFDDLERTLPSEANCQDNAASQPKQPRKPLKQSEEEKAIKFFKEIRNASASGELAEATTWRHLDRELWVATRSLLKPEEESQEMKARRWNAARLEAYAKGMAEHSEEVLGYLVSVVCPTTARRRRFHPLLYQCFKYQDYGMKELIIIETCEEPPSDFWLDTARRDPAVLYRHFAVPEDSWSVGLKRNLACCFATGTLIAHFDDDDLYAPCYLSSMVQRLLDPPAHDELVCNAPVHQSSSSREVADALGPFSAACAKLATWLKFSVQFNMWFMCDPSQDNRLETGKDVEHCLFGWGFSYVYLRSAWLMCPFPHIQLGEDFRFVKSLRACGFPVLLVRGASKICAHTQHGKNTSGKFMELSEPLAMADAVLKICPLAPLLDLYQKTVQECQADEREQRNLGQ